jgi:hypothetical protein
MAQGTRFMRKGRTKFYFVTTIADLTPSASPTVAEILAGVDISKDIATVSGFSFASSPIDTPDFEDTFTKQIGGEDKAAESSFELYQRDRHDTNTDTIYEAMEKGDVGYVVIVPDGLEDTVAGLEIGDIVDVWPVEVTSKSKTYSADNTAAKYMVTFSMREVPTIDFALTA